MGVAVDSPNGGVEGVQVEGVVDGFDFLDLHFVGKEEGSVDVEGLVDAVDQDQ